jgi:alkylhydroperoxidase/carboxymuconolactone decarboxylase family protein YurZ
MPITDTARKNHEELFPNHRSTLKLTDPELIEVFDNFAFDEVLRHGNLDTKTRLMAILASLIAQQTLSEYKIMLGGTLNLGVTPIEAKEILYHPSVPYVGIAKAFEFIQLLGERGLPRIGLRTMLAPGVRLTIGFGVRGFPMTGARTTDGSGTRPGDASGFRGWFGPRLRVVACAANGSRCCVMVLVSHDRLPARRPAPRDLRPKLTHARCSIAKRRRPAFICLHRPRSGRRGRIRRAPVLAPRAPASLRERGSSP